ncbi:MAG: FKBP-type peptidyl-prolyl cis-trans isomerase [Tidjanibacter sp.]|nr:FKBP-type peptidyl-prolyl cis-trans isomerase [Tidjanibacter sp.]
MALVNNNSAYKERNLEYLKEYAQREGVQVLPGGVMYRELTRGKGDRPTPKSLVTVHYRGMLINGKVFDATQKGHPATFKLNQLIDGWRTALRQMPVGARWEIVIPFNLGYGARGAGVIKPFSTLIFEVQLLAIG